MARVELPDNGRRREDRHCPAHRPEFLIRRGDADWRRCDRSTECCGLAGPAIAMSIIGAYDSQAEVLAARYESVSAETVHAALLDFLPAGRDLLALDVGAGSGRDAAWLASLGFDVVAAEPAAGMRREGQRRHPDARIRWIDDRLPDMSAVYRLGLAYDLVLLSAVWMHVPPDTRARAFRKVVTLLKPGGTIFISLREGESEADRPMWETPPGEIEALSRSLGLQVLTSVATPDRLERPGVRWTVMCLRLPDDGAGALPLLRGIILKDGKSSTYKLGLLRAVARMADTAPALAHPRADEDVVELPLGAVALNWLRMYIPLVRAGFPQRLTNSGPDGLDFAKGGFRQLLADGVVAQDLRIGMPFVGDRAAALRSALIEATHTIARRPAHYTTFPNSDTPVFAASRASPPRLDGDLVLDRDFLSAFGRLTVPGHVWRTLQRLGPWVSPCSSPNGRDSSGSTRTTRGRPSPQVRSRPASLGSIRSATRHSPGASRMACSRRTVP